MSLESFAGSPEAVVSAIFSHVWQSSLLVILAALLNVVFRNSEARWRYWIWFAASLKILLPFSLLFFAGSHSPLSTRTFTRDIAYPPKIAASASSHRTSLIEELDVRIKARKSYASLRRTFSDALILDFLFGVWFLGCLIVAIPWFIEWRSLQRAIDRATLIDSEEEITATLHIKGSRYRPYLQRVILSEECLEPGVYGILNQLLVWPLQASQFLNEEESEAIVEHEIGHMLRKDNLTACIHMMIEAIFWFHPLVWWVGRRLRMEREFACDEEVLARGHDQETYAQGILKVGSFCVGSVLPCASGVSGGDLGDRIERIMARRRTKTTSLPRHYIAWGSALLLFVLPFAFGMSAGKTIQEPQAPNDLLLGLPAFDVATIKPNRAPVEGGRITFTRNGFKTTATSVVDLIKLAYGVEGDQVSGLPGSALKDTYDVDAKVGPDIDLDKLTPLQRRLMVRPLLADRFGLRLHIEPKRLPAYVLLIGKGGSKLIEDPPDKWGTPGQQALRMVGKDHLVARGVPMEGLIQALSDQLERPVIDGTGLTKNYDFSLVWKSEEQTPQPHSAGDQGQSGSASSDSEEGSLFSAVREQLGLKLEKQKGSVESLVIDHFQKPSAN